MPRLPTRHALFLVLAGACLLFAAPADARRDYQCGASGIPDQFDPFFFAAAKRHLPLELRDNWCLLKAQCYVESHLKPDAVSPAGAVGACQVMPGTADDLRKRGFWRGRLRSAKDNVEAGAVAFAHYWKVWIFKRSTECRLELAWASYNAGPGSIIEAQKESGGKRCWDGIAPHLHKVTGRHAEETLAYVQRIWRAWRQMRGYSLN